MMNHCTDLDTWLSTIAQRHTPEINLGLERISHIAEQLQVNRFNCPVITVAGTNGKGTTVAALQHLYTSGGYRVGSYFSPHLHHFTERVMLNNKAVEEAQLCDAFREVAEAVGDLPLTFFEFITLAALLIFKNNKLDLLILEVGLGGRLDAVNCVDNDLAIVTQIAFDHCDRLGHDRESIGAEKAGIFREKKIALCADPVPPQSLTKQAQRLNCAFYQVGRDFDYERQAAKWSWWTAEVQLDDLPIPKIPMTSAACVLMVSYLLAEQLPLSNSNRVEAVKNTTLPGRFQIFQDRCPIIFDVAHNEAAAILLAEQLATTRNNGKTFAVFSVLADKDCTAIVGALRGMIDEWHVLPLQTPRATKSDEIVQQIKALFDQPCYNHADVASMWTVLREKLQPQDRVVVFGSFYTVAAVQSELSAQSKL